MPVITRGEFTDFETHGSSFASYVRPATGSTELCAWRLVVPAGLQGAAHRPSREEILLILEGELSVTIDRVTNVASVGDVVLVPAGSEFRVDGSALGATAWVTTSAGLEAVTGDGHTIQPPWAQ